MGTTKPGAEHLVRAIELCNPPCVAGVRKLRTELGRLGTTHTTAGGATHMHLWPAILRLAGRCGWRAGGPETGNPPVRPCLRGHVLLLQCAQTG